MPDKLDAIHQQLGELNGVQKMQGKALGKIEESFDLLVRNTAKTDQLLRASIQHDKRIGALEGTATLHEERIAVLSEHAKADVPVEAYLGICAGKILVWLVCGVIGWLASYALPKLIPLIKG